MASYMHHWGNVPDWSENWAEPKIAPAINVPTASPNSLSPTTKSTPLSQNYALTPLASDLADLALEPWSSPDTPVVANVNNTIVLGGEGSQPAIQSPTWSEIEKDLRSCFEEDRSFSDLPALD